MTATLEQPTVLIADDNAATREAVVRLLEKRGYRVIAFADGESFLAELPRILPDVVILDVGLPGMSGLEVLERCRSHHPGVPVVMLTGDDDVETVVKAVQLGAFEYLLKPPDPTRLFTTVRNAVAHRAATERVRALEFRIQGGSFPGILGTGEAMVSLFADMRRVAPTDVSVLIRGESGSGKELVARALHDTGKRASGPFVAINCAAVPESLQESELFGHERGAFTGATSRRIGRFEQADGGTLFLDEVSELSLALQAKLLRVVQERSFHRVGGTTEVRSDFRLVVATHRDLAADAREGRFREDLYFRVAVFELLVPPLRERGADILLLAHSFARDIGIRIRGEPCELLPETAAALMAYTWPGNVRELQNVIQRAAVMASSREISPSHLTASVVGARPVSPAAPSPPMPPLSPVEALRASTAERVEHFVWDQFLAGVTLEGLERRAVEAAVRRHGGNRSKAARELGITRATLYRKLEPS